MADDTATSNPPIDIASAFSKPTSSTVFGPVVLSCLSTVGDCLRWPDTLESAFPPGKKLTFGELSTARPGDFLYGTASEIGLSLTDDKWKVVLAYVSRGQDEYDEYLSKPQQAAVVNGPKEIVDLPPDVRAAIITYPRTAAARLCTIAVKALRDYRKDNASAPVSSDDDAVTQTEAVFQAVYRDSCLVKDPDPRLSSVTNNLVYFIDGHAVTCAGIVVSKNIVLTARHCFVPDINTWMTSYQVNGIPPDYKLAIENVPGRRAVVIGDMTKAYAVQVLSVPANGDLSNFNPVTAADQDFLFVQLIGASLDDLPDLMPVGPISGDQLRIPALFLDGAKVLSGFSTGSSEQRVASLVSELRFDTSPLCTIVVHPGRCIVHDCQTDHGYSGTPIFALRGDTYELVGVHTGSFDPSGKLCDFHRTRFFPNYGVVVPMSSVSSVEKYAP